MATVLLILSVLLLGFVLGRLVSLRRGDAVRVPSRVPKEWTRAWEQQQTHAMADTLE